MSRAGRAQGRVDVPRGLKTTLAQPQRTPEFGAPQERVYTGVMESELDMPIEPELSPQPTRQDTKRRRQSAYLNRFIGLPAWYEKALKWIYVINETVDRLWPYANQIPPQEDDYWKAANAAKKLAESFFESYKACKPTHDGNLPWPWKPPHLRQKRKPTKKVKLARKAAAAAELPRVIKKRDAKAKKAKERRESIERAKAEIAEGKLDLE